MSGLDKIISRLEASCSSECEKIIKDAEAQAQKKLEQAISENEKISAEIISAAEKEAALIKEKATSAAGVGSRRAMLAARVELINETIDNALKKLRSLDAPSYFTALKKLALGNKQPGTGVIMFSEADLKRLPEGFADELQGIKVSDTPCDIEDGFILKYGDIEINCTFKSLLNASRDELKATAGDILFG